MSAARVTAAGPGPATAKIPCAAAISHLTKDAWRQNNSTCSTVFIMNTRGA